MMTMRTVVRTADAGAENLKAVVGAGCVGAATHHDCSAPVRQTSFRRTLRRRTLRRRILRMALAAVVVSICSAAAAIEPARQAELRNLLEQDCGSCHGMTMKGGLGPALLPANLNGKPDGLLIAAILEGRPGTAMPPWRSLLTEAEAEWLVEQLREGPE